MSRFSIIIVNYNGGDYLRCALQSLQTQTVTDFEVFVVDNASSDSSLADVVKKYGGDTAVERQTLSLPLSSCPKQNVQLHVLAMNENLGFAAANNLAAESASGEWLVLLNPDAEADAHWLEELANAAARHPDTTMFASAQFDLHNPDLLDGVGDAYFICGIPWRGGFGHPKTELPAEGTCFSPCGAGAMYRRDLFLDHGGFDERFFCYCEDVDLGFRLRLAGENCVFIPSAIIHHAGGGVAGRASEFSLYHGARNRFWTYIKNMPLRILIPTFPIHAALIVAILYRNRKTHQHRPTLRGLRDGLSGMGTFLSERRALKRRRNARVIDIADAMSWNIFRMRNRAPHVQSNPAQSRLSSDK